MCCVAIKKGEKISTLLGDDGSDPDEDADFDPRETLEKLLDFIDGVCGIAIRCEPNTFIIEDAVLDFYELTCRMHTDFGLTYVSIPKQGVVYSCVLASTAATVSRMCSVLSSVREEIKTVEALAIDSSENTGLETADYVTYFFQDITEMLFLQTIFQPKPKQGTILYNAPVFLRQTAIKGDLKTLRQSFRQFVEESVSDLIDVSDLGGALDLTRYFAGFTFKYLDNMRKKAGQKAAKMSLQLDRVNQSDKYRARLLKFLKSQSMDGITNFMTDE
jgi:hypothetical protein